MCIRDRAAADLLQQQVAHVVAQGVIELLEVVQVDEQQCALAPAACTAGQGELQVLSLIHI